MTVLTVTEEELQNVIAYCLVTPIYPLKKTMKRSNTELDIYICKPIPTLFHYVHVFALRLYIYTC